METKTLKAMSDDKMVDSVELDTDRMASGDAVRTPHGELPRRPYATPTITVHRLKDLVLAGAPGTDDDFGPGGNPA